MSALEYVFLRVEELGVVNPKWRYRITRPEVVVSSDIFMRGAEAEDAGGKWLAAHGYAPSGEVYPNSWRRARTGTSELLLAARAVVGEEAAVGSVSLGSMNRLLKAVEEIDAF